jgi:hypothetical protein
LVTNLTKSVQVRRLHGYKETCALLLFWAAWVDRPRISRLDSTLTTAAITFEPLEEWQPIAGPGDASTQSNVGLLYAHSQDYLKALVWYLKAADQGVSAAQYNLA